MKALYDLPAPAKLNLFLHVTGRRDDGYHLLQSVFMLVDWWDVLSFELRNDGQISRSDSGALALPAQDLSVRAASALQQASGHRQGVHIHLDKHLPAQAGLGGGSSDAATTLLALNRLWGLNWPRSRLAQIGVRLGADVPFFLGGHNAWVEGIGEQLTPLSLPHARFAILKPAAGVPTAEIFQSPDLKRDSNAATMPSFAAQPFDFGRNDLQPVAQMLCPQVTQALQWLQNLGLRARMTGSGSAVFAPLNPGVTFPKAPPGWQLKPCSNLEVHPLAMWASSDK